MSALLLLLHVQLMDDPEGLEELVEVDAAVLVEIDAACHVVNGSVVHIHTQVRTEQVPCLAELLDGNLTCEKRGLKPINNTRQIQIKSINNTTNPIPTIACVMVRGVNQAEKC